MSSLIKDVYSTHFFAQLNGVLKTVVPGFNKNSFMKTITAQDFEAKEWKGRMQAITFSLNTVLDTDYTKANKQLMQLVDAFKQQGGGGIAHIFLPDYIAQYGITHFKDAVKALEHTTQFISCEFAVRPFLIQYPDAMLQQMIKWSAHKSHAVRRLASEGARPRLPWAMALPAYKKDPQPLLPLLENLITDNHEWVRLSVANHLNDISKDHPAVFLQLAQKWKGKTKETDAIIKHASRTLLKAGHQDILNLFNLDDTGLTVSRFKVLTPEIKTGESVLFEFTVTNTNTVAKQVRLEYAVYYQKSKGHLTKKVFKISERLLQPGEKLNITRKQSFKPITTRVFHKGLHKVAVIINGKESAAKPFQLL
jgi:3-methyladenine DNA glycosylase AlkC